MAEQDTSQEKTEEATPQKLERSRKEGEAPRSRELATTALLIVGAGSLLLLGGGISTALLEVARNSFSFDYSALDSHEQAITLLTESWWTVFGAVVPVLMALSVAGIASSIALGGFILSAKAFTPKASRMSPAAGLKRMFSMKALIELMKSIAKVLVIAVPAIVFLTAGAADTLGLAQQSQASAILDSIRAVGIALLVLALCTIVIAAIDIPIQIVQFSKKLKMTMQEVKDEMKDTEGRPEVKGRRRQVAQEISQRRMLDAVPDADLVIVNPEHYAVALAYSAETMAAPVVLAKGVDHMAMRIRNAATAADIPLVEIPPLARSIYYHTEIGDAIPAGLYVAVAQVLAYVYQLKQYAAGKARRPVLAKDMPIPDELRK